MGRVRNGGVAGGQADGRGERREEGRQRLSTFLGEFVFSKKISGRPIFPQINGVRRTGS